MAEKKFYTPEGKLVDAEISADFESARLFDKLKVGKSGVFFREDLRLKYIPYSFIQRAFIRIHEVNGRMCCGNTTFQYFTMVFVHDGKEYGNVLSEKEDAMDAALALIHETAPEIAIGVEEK